MLARMAAHAQAVYPEECCGILLGRMEPSGVFVGRVLPCENAAPAADRRRRFTIEPQVVLDAIRSLGDGPEQLVGFYHSHPNRDAALSPTDMEFVRLWPETAWVVIPVLDGAPGTPRAWWLSSAEETIEEMRWV